MLDRLAHTVARAAYLRGWFRGAFGRHPKPDFAADQTLCDLEFDVHARVTGLYRFEVGVVSGCRDTFRATFFSGVNRAGDADAPQAERSRGLPGGVLAEGG